MTPRWVKKRDGRIEPFDEARIARGVIRGGRRTAPAEELERLGREIARSVTMSLSRESSRRRPETTHIASRMAEALERTGHVQIAQAVREWRDWRARRQAEVRVREETWEGGESARRPEVFSLRAARPWSKPRIVAELVEGAGLERESAEDVARAVEERVFAAGLNQISTTLLRELIDGELFERGFSAQLGRLEVLGIPKPDLAQLAFLGQGRAPVALEDRVSRAALARFALDEIVEGPGAVAHRRGEIHLLGLGRPFRMAGAGLDAPRVVAGPEEAPPPDVYEAARRLIQSARGAATSYHLSLGLVSLEQALAPFADDRPALRGALRLLIEALIDPVPDDLPPSPELVLDCAPESEAGRIVFEETVAALSAAGARASGVRLLVRLREPDAQDLDLLRLLREAAETGAECDLALGPGGALRSRGMGAHQVALQVGLINLAGAALAAGRGQRERFSARLAEAVEAALAAFHLRRRRVFSSVVRPAFPLFGETEGVAKGEEFQQADALWDVVGVVGLDAAMRYLTGESPRDNARVAELAGEVLGELAALLAQAGARLGLGEVLLEDVPAGDAGIRLAAQDLERFPDAHDLLGGAEGWDVGLDRLSLSDPAALREELGLRLWLHRRARFPLVIGREVLAGPLEPEALWEAILEGMRGTTRRRRSARGSHSGSGGTA